MPEETVTALSRELAENKATTDLLRGQLARISQQLATLTWNTLPHRPLAAAEERNEADMKSPSAVSEILTLCQQIAAAQKIQGDQINALTAEYAALSAAVTGEDGQLSAIKAVVDQIQADVEMPPESDLADHFDVTLTTA